MSERKALLKTLTAVSILVSIACYSSILSKNHLFDAEKHRRNPEYDNAQIANHHETIREMERKQTCNPSRSVAFIKTHKTAGSSVKGVLLKYKNRIGIKHQVVYYPPFFVGGYPGYFRSNFTFYTNASRRSAITHESSYRPPDLLMTEHLRFQKDEVLSFMPHNSKFITILRDPMKQFQSAFNYYYGRYSKFTKKFHKIVCFGAPYLEVVGEFGVNITEYIKRAKGRLDSSFPWYFRSRNYQSFDLGLDPLNFNTDYIRRYVWELDSIMDLVMITDYFEESLILLKDALCMDWKDLIMPHLAEGNYIQQAFTEEEENMIRSINKQDFILYEYFNKTFWQKVDNYGRANMERDIKTLRSLSENIYSNDAGLSSYIKDNVSTKKRSITDVRKSKYIPLSDHGHHLDQLVTRMKRECVHHGFCLNSDSTYEVANYMMDNMGMCRY